MNRSIWALTIASSLLLSGCLNVFSPFDSPTSDSQLLSAGRSCLDRGDFACAQQNFSKLSSSSSETAAAESAFSTLQQAGAGMQAFIGVFGTGSNLGSANAVGNALNALATYFSSNANLATRQQIFQAYAQVQNIPTNNQLRGLVRFASGAAFLAEIFAEGSGQTGTLKRSDLVSNGTACAAESAGVCATDLTTTSNCGMGSSKFTSGPGRFKFGATSAGGTSSGDTVLTYTDTKISGGLTLDMIDAAIGALGLALGSSELGGNGGLGGNASSFATNLQNGSTGAALALNADPSQSPCYRFGLLSFGIGAQ